MDRAKFIEEVTAIVERVQQSAQGIGDWMGEALPEDAAKDIANLLPQSVWDW